MSPPLRWRLRVIAHGYGYRHRRVLQRGGRPRDRGLRPASYPAMPAATREAAREHPPAEYTTIWYELGGPLARSAPTRESVPHQARGGALRAGDPSPARQRHLPRSRPGPSQVRRVGRNGGGTRSRPATGRRTPRFSTSRSFAAMSSPPSPPVGRSSSSPGWGTAASSASSASTSKSGSPPSP